MALAPRAAASEELEGTWRNYGLLELADCVYQCCGREVLNMFDNMDHSSQDFLSAFDLFGSETYWHQVWKQPFVALLSQKTQVKQHTHAHCRLNDVEEEKDDFHVPLQIPENKRPDKLRNPDPWNSNRTDANTVRRLTEAEVNSPTY